MEKQPVNFPSVFIGRRRPLARVACVILSGGGLWLTTLRANERSDIGPSVPNGAADFNKRRPALTAAPSCQRLLFQTQLHSGRSATDQFLRIN
jgi:hypothetical protein